MNFNEYQESSKRTMPKPGNTMVVERDIVILTKHSIKTNYAMGISGEAGEVTDLVKKEIFHGHKQDVEKVKKEIGDVLHYAAGLATLYDLSLEEVAIANIEKLQKRFPNGFNTEDSIKRVDANE
jgi:NTP pyrophosphatase (non-canonical NTP hydrolase)